MLPHVVSEANWQKETDGVASTIQRAESTSPRFGLVRVEPAGCVRFISQPSASCLCISPAGTADVCLSAFDFGIYRLSVRNGALTCLWELEFIRSFSHVRSCFHCLKFYPNTNVNSELDSTVWTRCSSECSCSPGSPASPTTRLQTDYRPSSTSDPLKSPLWHGGCLCFFEIEPSQKSDVNLKSVDRGTDGFFSSNIFLAKPQPQHQ